MASPTDIRKGRVIMYNGVPHAVMSMLHRTQGRQAGFVQTVLRNLSNNSSTAVKFRSTDSVEFCHTTNKPFEFSYVDGDHFHFIDPETYDDIVLMQDTIGDDVKWLVEGVLCRRQPRFDRAAQQYGNKGGRGRRGAEGRHFVGADKAGDSRQRYRDSGSSLHQTGRCR